MRTRLLQRAGQAALLILLPFSVLGSGRIKVPANTWKILMFASQILLRGLVSIKVEMWLLSSGYSIQYHGCFILLVNYHIFTGTLAYDKV